MKATVMYGAGDVRVENVPDAHLIEATDALVVVTRAAICGSDLWPYQEMEPDEVEAVLRYVGLLGGGGPPPGTGFTHADGSPGRVNRHADLIR